MVTKAPNHSDLQNLENRIKLEIREQEKQDRHNLDNKLWTYFFKVDELDKKSAVNDNILKTMTSNIEKLEQAVTEWFEKMTNKIDWFQDKFATKEDHKENSTKISLLEKWVSSINLKIATISGGMAVVMFLIQKYVW